MASFDSMADCVDSNDYAFGHSCNVTQFSLDM